MADANIAVTAKNTEKKRLTIGFFVSELENPYAQTLCRGIIDAAVAADANVIIFPGKSPKVPYDYQYQHNAIYTLASPRNIDALILATGTMVNFLSAEEFKAFYGRYGGIPIVSISIPLEGVSSVLIDNKAGLKDALGHLIEAHGFERIAFIGGPPANAEAQERRAAYLEVLGEHGLPYDPALVFEGDFTKYSGVRAVAEFLDARRVPFQALVAANDEMALSAMEELQRRGVRVPRDVAVVGFDDVENARYAAPTLTTVVQPIYEQACNAVWLACRLVKGGEAQSVTLPTSMMLRESCGCLQSSGDAPSGADVAARLHLLEDYYKSNQKRWDGFNRNIVGLREVLNLLICDVSNAKGALRSITSNLREMGMGCFYAFLHDGVEKHEITTDWDFARKVTLAAADDDRAEGSEWSGASMPVGSILDGGIYFKGARRTLVVTSLFYMNEHFGFVVCEPNFGVIYFFESLMAEISCALKLIGLMQSRQKIERQLQDAIEELDRYNEQLSSASETDELTELFNRRGFMNHTRHMFSMGRRMKKDGILFFADLDGLKGINDSHGHEEGDSALRAVAAVLRKAFRDSDIIARLGGDEFTVFTLNTHAGMFDIFDKRIAGLVDEYNQKSQKPYSVSISIGMVPFSHEDEVDIETLMHKADMLLYRQKKEKKERNKIQTFRENEKKFQIK